MESRPAVSSGSLLRVRDSLTRRFQSSLYARAKECKIPLSEFQDWVEELVGEGIAIALSQIDSWDEERGDFLCWSFLKTRTVIDKDLRKRRRRVETVELQEFSLKPRRSDRYDPANKVVVREQLKKALASLTREQGEALAFRYLMGFSVKEIERLTGCKGATLYTIMRRGREKARKTRDEGS